MSPHHTLLTKLTEFNVVIGSKQKQQGYHLGVDWVGVIRSVTWSSVFTASQITFTIKKNASRIIKNLQV